MPNKSANLLIRFSKKLENAMLGLTRECINIGCGSDVRLFWKNCDVDPKHESVQRFDITNDRDLRWLECQQVDLITCDHVIGYLTLAQADNFFKACFAALTVNGRLILEFPDLIKLAKLMLELDNKSIHVRSNYVEIIRAIYAYDSEDAESLVFNKKTYITGWTASYLGSCLEQHGFKEIHIADPQTHGNRKNRDTRVVAIKSK